MKIHPLVEALRQARKVRGWSQADLAKRSGVHENTISSWESGATSPNLDLLSKAVAVFGLQVSVEPPAPRPEGRPRVEVEPPMRFGVPHVGGVSCEAIAYAVIADGVNVAADEFNLRRQDVLAACWFLGLHGGRRWRFWRDWAQDADTEMAHTKTVEYARIPDPPDRPTAAKER